MRLNQYIESSGMCSRREADELIASGKVMVNGKKAVLGQQVAEGDEVTAYGKPIRPDTERICILVNKPAGITSTTDKSDKSNIIDYVNHKKRLFTVGRLDKDSTGAILLTNDGTIVNKLLRSENEHNKTYLVEVNKPLTPDFLAKMRAGVKIFNPESGGMVTTKPCKTRQIKKYLFEIVLTQGYNRQIRRMCETLDYKVISLHRIKFLFLSVSNLQVGRFRNLTKQEMAKLDETVK